MPGDTSDAKNDASVLYRVVWIPQPASDSSDFTSQALGDQLPKPILMDHFHVVIYEAHYGAARLAYCGVIECRKIKWPGVTKYSRMPLFLQLVKEGKDDGIVAAIVDDKEFYPRIRSVVPDAVYTGRDQLSAIPREND